MKYAGKRISTLKARKQEALAKIKSLQDAGHGKGPVPKSTPGESAIPKEGTYHKGTDAALKSLPKGSLIKAYGGTQQYEHWGNGEWINPDTGASYTPDSGQYRVDKVASPLPSKGDFASHATLPKPTAHGVLPDEKNTPEGWPAFHSVTPAAEQTEMQKNVIEDFVPGTTLDLGQTKIVVQAAVTDKSLEKPQYKIAVKDKQTGLVYALSPSVFVNAKNAAQAKIEKVVIPQTKAEKEGLPGVNSAAKPKLSDANSVGSLPVGTTLHTEDGKKFKVTKHTGGQTFIKLEGGQAGSIVGGLGFSLTPDGTGVALRDVERARGAEYSS